MISVIVPVYNCEENLGRCVQSILNQSETHIEVILVNDGSTDRSPEICNKYAEEDTRVRVIHQENGGVSKARNAGIQAAKGEYIQFVDSDDYLEKDMCKRMIEVMEEQQSDLVISGFHHHYLGRDIIKCPRENLTSPVEMKRLGNTFLELYQQGFLNMPWNKLYKKEKIAEQFPEHLSLGEDLLFNLSYLKQLKNTEKVSLISSPLYHYIQERGKVTLSSQKRNDKLQIARQICQATEDFYHQNLNQSGGEEIIYSRMVSEFLCDLAESVYDKTMTYQTFQKIAAQYTNDSYTRKINHNISNLPPDLKILNIFFQKAKIRPLWYLCRLRRLALNILQNSKGV